MKRFLVLLSLCFFSALSQSASQLASITWADVPKRLSVSDARGYSLELSQFNTLEKLQCVANSNEVLLWSVNSSVRNALRSRQENSMSAQLEVFPITYQGNKAYFVAINQTRQRAFTGLWFASDKQLVLVWCGTVYKQAVDFLSSRAAEKPKGDKLSLADHSFVAPVHWSELAWILPNGSPKTQLVDIFQSKLPRGRACQSDIELLLWNPEVTKLSPDEVIKVGKSDLGIAHLIYRVLGPLPSGGEEFLALQNMQRWYGRWILGEKNAALVWCKLK